VPGFFKGITLMNRCCFYTLTQVFYFQLQLRANFSFINNFHRINIMIVSSLFTKSNNVGRKKKILKSCYIIFFHLLFKEMCSDSIIKRSKRFLTLLYFIFNFDIFFDSKILLLVIFRKKNTFYFSKIKFIFHNHGG
jgi:hypothetical protein